MLRQYEGYYTVQGYRLDVRVINDQLTATVPGVPQGFEVVLEPTESPDAFVLRRGPLDGVTVQFRVGDNGTALGLRSETSSN